MNRTGLIALAVFILLAGGVLSLGPTTQRRLSASVAMAIAPMFNASSNVGRKIRTYTTGVKTLGELEAEVARLRAENEKLRVDNQLSRDLSEENGKLRDALGFRQRSSYRLVPARLIARESATWWSQVQIDRGAQDGLAPDLPVLTEAGLVGKTTTVAGRTSYVLLVADENCKVAATVENTREQGIVSGTRTSSGQQPEMMLNFLSKAAELKPGQKVYSSGVTGGVFPSGLLLGTVAEEPKVRELDARARVLPAVDMSRLENVFVIVPGN